MIRVATPVFVSLALSTSLLAAESASISVKALLIPEKARAKYSEGERKLAKHDPAGARKKFEEAIGLAPEYAAAWNALGVMAENPTEAEADFRRAVECDPDNLDAVLNLGGVLLKTGRAEEALAYNQRAAMEIPNDAAAQAQFGMTLYQLGRLAEAERALITAKRINAQHELKPQLFLAEIYARRGQRELAAAELRQMLSVDQDPALARTIEAALARLRE